MKVLFIDDEVERFEKMLELQYLDTHTATHVNNGIKAIDAIVDNGPWDIIYFDHDLATFVQEPYKREITGNDVAKVLVKQEWKPSKVYIHSSNTIGAENIKHTLEDSGIHSICVYPFWKLLNLTSKKSNSSS